MIGSKYKVIVPPVGTDPAVFGVTDSGTLFGVACNALGNAIYFVYSNGKYSPVTVPNASGFQLLGVDPRGTALVGSYTLSSEVEAGFVSQNGSLTTVQFPGSIVTEALAINRAGQVVGEFEDASFAVHGFTWTPPTAKQN